MHDIYEKKKGRINNKDHIKKDFNMIIQNIQALLRELGDKYSTN